MDTELLIREIQIEDYEEIWNLNLQLGYKYSIDNTKSRIEKILSEARDKVFVGVLKNKVIAYIHLQPYELLYYDSLVNILGLVVDKKYRRKGFGKELIRFSEKWSKTNDFKGIRLLSGMERVEAHKFYTSCGFAFIKNQKNFIKEIKNI